jgi:hypothetical protein
MLWATDLTGMQIITSSPAIYDCGDQLSHKEGLGSLIGRYELGLSRAVMKAGYSIAATQPKFRVIPAEEASVHAAVYPDFWHESMSTSATSVVFAKVSRSEYPHIYMHKLMQDGFLNARNMSDSE